MPTVTDALLCAILIVNVAQLYAQSEVMRRMVRDTRLRFQQWRGHVGQSR